MNEDTNLDDEARKHRQPKIARTRPPRAARTAQYQKKAVGLNGVHRRRNKHWSW